MTVLEIAEQVLHAHDRIRELDPPADSDLDWASADLLAVHNDLVRQVNGPIAV